MNNSFTIELIKAGFTTCLFLCLTGAWAQSQNEWIDEKRLLTAYDYALQLKAIESRSIANTYSFSAEQVYVQSVNDILELLLTEDESLFEKHEDDYETRINRLEDINPTPSVYFALAEVRLQWAFVYLKFGHEFDAAWNIRQAYKLVQDCKQTFPGFLPIKKTSGVLEIMLGSVPEKYQWVISLLGMQGSVEKGLKELNEVRTKSASLHLEASLLYFLIQGYIFQNTELAVKGLQDDLLDKTNPLILFFTGALAIKNSQSETALNLLKKIDPKLITYTYYQLGEVYLHKGDYELAIQSYQNFLKDYKGQNFIKDAQYKTGISYWLKGNAKESSIYFEKAKIQGKESTEADKYAARNLSENTLPNAKLSKIRYATDGGYYEIAKNLVTDVKEEDLESPKEKIEFVYRKARLLDKTNSAAEAITLYQQTIELQGSESWYFAPNACLQLGYLMMAQNKKIEAQSYFEKAISYKKHEYKNSIDSKAKSALAKIKSK